MKKTLSILAALTLMGAAAQCFAAATVTLNNYDADKPIYIGAPGTVASGADVWVELLGGTPGGTLAPIASTSGLALFGLAEPGYFDSGVGTIPGLADNATAEFQLRAWKGAASYDAAFAVKETAISAKWTQATGAWNPAAQPPVPASGPVLAIPGNLVLAVVPEPSTIALGLLGAAMLLIRRRK